MPPAVAMISLRWLAIGCLICATPPIMAATWSIDTVAGRGAGDINGHGGKALDININQPFGVEVGPDDALYITEVGHHRVWRLDRAAGKLSVVAGSGKKGYAGDGGPATAAAMNEPYETRFDA